MKFKWICSKSLANLCDKIDSPNFLIKFADYQNLIKKPENDLTFDIELILSKDKRIANKKVILTLVKPIEIKKNSNEDLDISEFMTITPNISALGKEILFKLSFDLPTLKFSDYTYNWTIKCFKSENQYLNTRKENALKIFTDDLLSGVNNIILEVTNLKTKITYKKVYQFFKPLPPYGGRCDVSPPKGVSFKDEFEFTTSNWITSKDPLIYKIKYLNEEDKFLEITNGGILETKFKTKILPVGDKFFLEAVDSGGMSQTIPCTVKVDANKNLLQVEEYLDGVFDPVQKMMIMEVYKTNIKVIGSIKTNENKVDPRIAINDEAIQM